MRSDGAGGAHHDRTGAASTSSDTSLASRLPAVVRRTAVTPLPYRRELMAVAPSLPHAMRSNAPEAGPPPPNRRGIGVVGTPRSPWLPTPFALPQRPLPHRREAMAVATPLRCRTPCDPTEPKERPPRPDGRSIGVVGAPPRADSHSSYRDAVAAPHGGHGGSPAFALPHAMRSDGAEGRALGPWRNTALAQRDGALLGRSSRRNGSQPARPGWKNTGAPGSRLSSA